jgi:hypothetical protein
MYRATSAERAATLSRQRFVFIDVIVVHVLQAPPSSADLSLVWRRVCERVSCLDTRLDQAEMVGLKAWADRKQDNVRLIGIRLLLHPGAHSVGWLLDHDAGVRDILDHA